MRYRQITDISGENTYLERWTLIIPFIGWSIKLHKISRADDDRCQHDHPWWFFRIILWGGYEETVGNNLKVKKRRMFNMSFCGKNFRHRIIKLYRTSSWSLVVTGRNSGKWGFYTKLGYMTWQSFVDAARSARVLWCGDGRVLNEDEEKSK